MIINLKDRIWGVDVSSWQDYSETPQLPNLQLLRDAGARFIIARSTNGYVTNGKPAIDRLFVHYIIEAQRVGLQYATYAYMNYYSYGALGVTAAQWGEMQGNAVLEAIKPYPMPVFMDVESAPGAPRVETVWAQAMTIMENEIAVIDAGNGRMTGIYASTGWLAKYPSVHWKRPLFAANYNAVTEEYVKELVAKTGFSKLRIIQANSLGDINADGVPDGRKLGFENPNVDIDLWSATEEDYNTFFRMTPPDVPAPVEPTDAEKLAILWQWYRDAGGA